MKYFNVSNFYAFFIHLSRYVDKSRRLCTLCFVCALFGRRPLSPGDKVRSYKIVGPIGNTRFIFEARDAARRKVCRAALIPRCTHGIFRIRFFLEICFLGFSKGI